MRRYVTLWVFAVFLTALTLAGVQSTLDERRLLDEAKVRAQSFAGSIEESVAGHYRAKRFDRIAKILDRSSEAQRLQGIAVCAYMGESIWLSSRSIGFPKNSIWQSLCSNPALKKAVKLRQDSQWISGFTSRKLQFHAHPLEISGRSNERLVLLLVRELTYIRALWVESFFRTFLLAFLGGIGLLGMVTAQLRHWLKNHFGYLQRTFRWLSAGRRPPKLPSPEWVPISKDIDQLAAKILALSPAKKTIFSTLKESMVGRKLIVVANREPYIHQRKGEKIEVVRPASGLVTALEPILRQCGGLWIAHGSGSADVETADSNSEVAVPPSNPKYTLKRVWLTEEEEAGYYYGFSNEGLWPLCHLAHNRPIFRLPDWTQYTRVNQKFTSAIPLSTIGPDSIFLIQDYHFALLPKMLKERAQKSGRNRPKIGLFWHIPWPNPEAFGISPWSQDLLRGMLGADVIGFHTQYHCNNFLETCNRFLEARIDQEHFSVTMENHETRVRAFPIGIETAPVRVLSEDERLELLGRYGIQTPFVAVGVDRIDYTKGIVERFEAVERFLEKYPQYIGKFTLLQMGSPSRTNIPAYQALTASLEQVIQRVNSRFSEGAPPGYLPIVFLAKHHEWDEIQYFYQLGNVCLVTSLHDGMNLVAKEYVWCQNPERGSLILSKFTGASRELTEAFIVNPYSIEEIADTLHAAFSLPIEERVRRMTAMREKIQARSAYHWASDLIQALITRDENVSTPSLTSDHQDRSRLAKVSVV